MNTLTAAPREQVVHLPRQGVHLHTWRAGQSGPRVLLLHGFPQAGFIWLPVLKALGGQAQLLAPTQRGYAPSSCPSDDRAYQPKALVADLVELLEQEGAPFDLLVAHDWGGAVAWNLAAQRPDLLRRLMIVNAPHPATFLRGLLHDPVQQSASAYMNTLCRPGAAERLLADGGARLLQMFGPAPWLDAAQAARYRTLWEASLPTMLAWYRASPLRPPTTPDAAIHRITLPDAAVTVRVPTWVLWGEADTALPTGLLEGLERWVPQLHLERVPGASHWILHEQPERVLRMMQEALNRCQV